jgi:hypothetical protein
MASRTFISRVKCLCFLSVVVMDLLVAEAAKVDGLKDEDGWWIARKE